MGIRVTGFNLLAFDLPRDGTPIYPEAHHAPDHALGKD